MSRSTVSTPPSCRHEEDVVVWWVYFAVYSGFQKVIKIGSSATPEYRVKQLGTGSPWPLRLLWMYPGAQQLEYFLHRRFRASHLRGEWFQFTPDVRQHLADVRALGVGCAGRRGMGHNPRTRFRSAA